MLSRIGKPPEPSFLLLGAFETLEFISAFGCFGVCCCGCNFPSLLPLYSFTNFTLNVTLEREGRSVNPEEEVRKRSATVGLSERSGGSLGEQVWGSG